MRPDTAVILSAGRGTRMRPLTLTTPKPLLKLDGQPILAHVLERLQAAGVQRIIVNAHHLAEQIEAFLADYPAVTLLREEELQETGGAITAMLAQNLLPDAPFYVVNGDSYLGGRAERYAAPSRRCVRCHADGCAAAPGPRGRRRGRDRARRFPLAARRPAATARRARRGALFVLRRADRHPFFVRRGAGSAVQHELCSGTGRSKPGASAPSCMTGCGSIFPRPRIWSAPMRCWRPWKSATRT